MVKKLVLGKGLASLLESNLAQDFLNEIKEPPVTVMAIPEVPPQVESSSFENAVVLVDVSAIKANSLQPRKIFKESDLDELANSIRENGIIQPLIVTKTDDGLELIAGERRLRAAKKAGLEQVPVVIKKTTDRERLAMAIIENVQRSDLNCVEEALAYYQLMDDFKLTQEEVSKKIGKERSTIANFIRILKLPRTVVEMLQKELLSFGHAKVLAAGKDNETITRLANEAVTKNLSVRELERLLRKSNSTKTKTTNPFFDSKLDSLRDSLEKRTGFHFALKTKKAGAGEFVIKFLNEAEFNDVYDFLMK